MYPLSFDVNIYREENIDLVKFNDNELEVHYENLGKYDGRICCMIKNRNDFISLIDQKLDILEIGPLCFPCMDIKKKNVKTIDYFSKEELIENYRNDPNIDIEKICKVDYVVKDNKYSDVINERFDICFSSHNIEHVPCVITFLKNLGDVLKENGHVFLCIPDYRYCFDKYRSENNIFEVLDAYYNKTKTPTVIDVCESNFLVTHNDSKVHWKEQYETIQNTYLEFKKRDDFYKEKTKHIITNFDCIVDLLKKVYSGKYIDSHCWRFTPQSFENIINILYERNYISLKIHRIYNTLYNSCEFYCILKK